MDLEKNETKKKRGRRCLCLRRFALYTAYDNVLEFGLNNISEFFFSILVGN